MSANETHERLVFKRAALVFREKLFHIWARARPAQNQTSLSKKKLGSSLLSDSSSAHFHFLETAALSTVRADPTLQIVF